MKIHISLAAVLLLAACGGRQTQDGPVPAGSGRGMPRDSLQRELFVAWRAAQMPSVYGLIGARERLRLTSRQVTALDSIAEAVREQNRTFADSLGRFTRTGGGGPIRMPTNDAQRRDFITILQRMGANTRRGTDAVHAVLDAGQRTTACTLAVEERRERFGGVAPRGGIDGERRGGASGRRGRGMDDGMGARGMGSGGWPWCGERGMSRDSSRAMP
jgi:hypothetical protein